MRLPYHKMVIEIPIEGILQVEALELKESLNTHGYVWLKLLVDEKQAEEYVFQSGKQQGIQLYEKKNNGKLIRTFCGKPTNYFIQEEKSLYYLYAEYVTYTQDWDLTPKSQSFCNLEDTYQTVINQVVAEYQKKDVKDEATKGRKIPSLLLQYEETDWDFLKRLASHFGTYLFVNSQEAYGRVSFGVPKLNYGTNITDGEYSLSLDRQEYQKICLESEKRSKDALLSQEMTRWYITCRRRLYLGEEITFHGIRVIVTALHMRTKQGEVSKEYELCRKKGILCHRMVNPNIYGMSIPATVKECLRNGIRVHMDIDPTYQKTPKQLYFPFAIESSSFYCMPEVESRVHIYFPSHEEAYAIGVHAMNESAGSAGRNPAVKSFTAPGGSAMSMAEESYSFTSDSSGASSLSVGSDGNIIVTGKTIEITTPQIFCVGEAEGGPGTQIYIEAKESLKLEIGDGGAVTIDITEDVKIIAAFVMQDADIKEPALPLKSDIYAVISQKDEVLLFEANKDARGELFVKAVDQNIEKESKAKVRHGIFDLIGTIAVAGLIAVTGGAAAAVIVGIVAVVKIAKSAAEIDQGLTMQRKLEVGDRSKTENRLQTMLHMSDETYQAFSETTDMVFDVVSLTAANVNVSKLFQATEMGCKARLVGQALTVGGIQAGKSALDEYARTGKIDFKAMAINAAIGIVAGGTGVAAGKSAAAYATGKGITKSTFSKIAVEALSGGVVAGTVDTAIRKLTKFDPNASFLKSIIMYTGAMALSSATMKLMKVYEPIHVATGGFLAEEVDLVIPDIGSPISLKRNYDSSKNIKGILGTGWFFPYESYMQREEEEKLYIRLPEDVFLCFAREGDSFQEYTNQTGIYRLTYQAQPDIWELENTHNHRRYQYNNQGQLTAVLDQNKQKTLLYYRNNRLSSMTTPLGHEITYCFEEGRLTRLTDETGRFMEYQYENGQLVSVIDTNYGRTSYEYSAEGFLTRATDPAGITYLSNQYDQRGRVVKQVLDNGETCDLEYQEEYHRTIVNTAEGKTIYEYNKAQLPVSIIYPDQSKLSFQYDENYRCISKTNRNGGKYSWEYDSQSRILAETTPNGLRTEYWYDEKGDLIQKSDSSNRQTIYEYDQNHNQIRRKKLVQNNLSQHNLSQWSIYSYSYDEIGRLIEEIQPSKAVTCYSYTEHSGKPSRIQYPDGTEVLREYDSMDRMLSETDACGCTEYGYNADSYVTMLRDGEGNETRSFYDSMGRLLFLYPPKAWKNNGEGRIEYQYDFMAHQNEIRYPDGSHEKKFLNWEGKLLKRVHPNAYQEETGDGEGEIYEYDCCGYLAKIHYPDGGTERFLSDAEGNCIKHILPEDYQEAEDDGTGYCYEYEEDNRLKRVIRPDGIEEAVYQYDQRGNCTWRQNAEGNRTYYWYDDADQMIELAEPIHKEGQETYYRRTSYRYDSNGNRVEEKQSGGSWRIAEALTCDEQESYNEQDSRNEQELKKLELEAVTTGKDFTLLFYYDKNNRLIQVEDGNGARMSYTYDCRGNRIREEQRISNEVNKKIQYTYDKAGRLIEKKEMLEDGFGKGQEEEEEKEDKKKKNEKEHQKDLKENEIPGFQPYHTAITTYKRDENGNLVEIQTPEGYQILREYDLCDRIICETVVDQKNGIERSTRIRYDLSGNIITLSRQGKGTEAYEVQYGYDLKDRLIHAKEMEHAIFSYHYDKSNRLVSELFSDEMESLNRTYTYQYDSLGQLIARKNPYGVNEEENQYDVLGNLLMQKQADGEEIHTHYGIQGQIESIGTKRSINEKKHAQEYHYNARGQITGIKDGCQNETTCRLDHWGNILEMQNADGGKENYTYDYAGNITTATDANGNTISYHYNSQGHVSEIIDQEGKRERYWYDREGRKILSVDRLGNRIKTEYNVDGNPVREMATAPKGIWRVTRTWKYDGMGYLKQSSGGGITYQYQYQQDGKLLSKSIAGKTLAACTYYADGSLRTITDPNGKTITHQYDQAGRLKRIEDEDGKEIVAYQYTAGSKIKEIRHWNGIHTQYTYDCEGNISQFTTRNSTGELLCDLQYAYDLNGNRIEKTGRMVIPVDSWKIRLEPVHTKYTYDVSGRITMEQQNDAVVRYEYDLCGNRQVKYSDEGEERYQYNRTNQLVSRETSTGSCQYQYDSQGNLTKESSKEKEWHYQYNELNQPVSISDKSKTIQENIYDGEGLRSGIIENGKRSQFRYLHGELLSEWNEEAAQAKQYIRGNGVVALWSENQYYASHRDEQGSVYCLTGIDGQVENVYSYDAFGVIQNSCEKITNRLLYTGEQYDQETKQYYLRARYYNPVIGRFTQEDTYHGDGLNLYAYCRNNPVMYHDPSGLAKCGNPNGKAPKEEIVKKNNATTKAHNEGAENTNNIPDQYKDQVEQAIIAQKQAEEIAKNYKGKSVASDGEINTLSGWGRYKDKNNIINRNVTPEDVINKSKVIEHTLDKNSFLDNVNKGGMPGQSKASHAEKQLSLQTEKPMGVAPIDMCNDCKEYFKKLAIYENGERIVADPTTIRIFKTDGSVIEIIR